MFDRRSTLGDALADADARAVLERHLPDVTDSPASARFLGEKLGVFIALVPTLDPASRESLWRELAEVGPPVTRAPYPQAVAPNPDYEGDDIRSGSARLVGPVPVPMWDVIEVRLQGPSHGNPFLDVDLHAVFTRPDGSEARVGGFYDGDGVYLVRALADAEGDWAFVIRSTARSLDGVAGTASVTGPSEGFHGPVRVDGFHFRHADGTRHRPLGTTAYAWTHQPDELQEQTLRTLADAPFHKIRMCIFPKSYLYNSNEPADFPFPGSLETGFDLERFDTGHFRRLEGRIRQLAELKVQADLILFHPYDRWGFSELGPGVDDRYLRYVVRRLSAFANVWWSMANEYDLMWAKDETDWEHLAGIVSSEDAFDHLLSIHNCREPYDYSRPWITHVSIQRMDTYRTAENTDDWRERWGKPVIIDECAYEGDIDQGWGNITAEELVRRFWEGAVRGGYVGHGETYLPDRLGGSTSLAAVAGSDLEVLWWAKGGVLHGASPDRIAFLESVLAETPEGVLEPLALDWDVPWGGADGIRIGYFGFNRPRFRNLTLPEGDWEIHVIDTWGMTVERVPGIHRGNVRVDLPGRQHMAVRLRRTGSAG
jgi:hypothetical protein